MVAAVASSVKLTVAAPPSARTTLWEAGGANPGGILKVSTSTAGSLRLRRIWSSGGQVDGDNKQLETYGIAIAVERGAERPFSPEVVRAVTRFCRAVAPRIKLAPECVVAMGEVPYTKQHVVSSDELRLVEDVRMALPVPLPDGNLTIVASQKRIPRDERDGEFSDARRPVRGR